MRTPGNDEHPQYPTRDDPGPIRLRQPVIAGHFRIPAAEVDLFLRLQEKRQQDEHAGERCDIAGWSWP